MFDATFSLPLEFPEKSYLKLLDAIGDAEIVCIGDSSHGTQDYYEHRALISKLLIERRGFRMIAVEADWPDCVIINEYTHGKSTIRDPLSNFTRFPIWMWRNEVMAEFTEWMKIWNSSHKDDDVSFYGLDVYSLQKYPKYLIYRSIEDVVKYFESVDSSAAAKAKSLYSCFERFHDDPLLYSLSIKLGLDEHEAAFVMHHLFRKQLDAMKDDQFIAEINAMVVKDAEEYYRCSVDKDINTWNIRDRHMFKVLQRLVHHSKEHNKPSKIIVWAHNSHVGDARQTDMGKLRSEINIGQLCRESEMPVYNIGFLCHEGTVMAANCKSEKIMHQAWGAPGRVRDIIPSLPESHEFFLHSNFPNQDVLLIFKTLEKDHSGFFKKETDANLNKEMATFKLERFIGVVYCPQSERHSHYSSSSLSNQFDSIVFLDRTQAIKPILREE